MFPALPGQDPVATIVGKAESTPPQGTTRGEQFHLPPQQKIPPTPAGEESGRIFLKLAHRPGDPGNNPLQELIKIKTPACLLEKRNRGLSQFGRHVRTSGIDVDADADNHWRPATAGRDRPGFGQDASQLPLAKIEVIGPLEARMDNCDIFHTTTTADTSGQGHQGQLFRLQAWPENKGTVEPAGRRGKTTAVLAPATGLEIGPDNNVTQVGIAAGEFKGNGIGGNEPTIAEDLQ